MPRSLCIALALTVVATTAHAAGDAAGTTAGNFLSIGNSASVLAMGGAGLATGADLHAAAWNPASLGGLELTQFALSHATLVTQASQDWLSAGGRMGAGSTRWAVSSVVQNESGFQGRDALNNPTGSFSASNLAFGAQVARPFGEHASAGVGFKWARETLADASGTGFGFDAGVRASAGEFGFGLAARNVGGRMNYGATSYDLPGVIGVGASWTHPATGLRVALDANFPSAYYNDVRMGAEWTWKDRVALRAGYRMELNAPTDEQLSGASFGIGAGTGGVWVDYGFITGGADAQGSHRLSLTFRPGALHGGADARSTESVEPRVAPAPVMRSTPAPAMAAAPEAPTPTPARAPSPAPAATASATTGAAARHDTTAAAKPNAPSRAVRVPIPAPSHADAPASSASPKAPAATPANPKASSATPASPAASAPAGPKARSTTPASPAVAAPAGSKASSAAPANAAKSTASPAKPASASSTSAAPAAAGPTDAKAAAVPDAKPAPPAETKPAAMEAKPDSPNPSSGASAAPSARTTRPKSVTVHGHETLVDIAKQWDTSVAAIMMENNLVTDHVKSGQKLRLPPASR